MSFVKKGGTRLYIEVYLNTLLSLRENFSVKLITGFRGTGKLELLKNFIEYLKSKEISEDQIIFINFEETNTFMDFQQLYLHVNKKIANLDYAYLIFYGIQQIDGWEKAVNAFFLGASVEIYIADSNEKILLEKLVPLLPDNFDIIRMYPLSFSEFVQSSGTNITNLFEKYLKFGGLPCIFKYFDDDKISRQLLKGVLYESLLKDVIIKYSVRNSRLFQIMLNFLAINTGNSIKKNRLKKYFDDINRPITPFTAENYLNIISDAGFFYKISRYDVQNDILINGGEYFYCADNGICNALSRFGAFNETAMIKNVVCLELLRRGYEVYCARIGTMTADFFAVSDKNRICIQVLPVENPKLAGKLLKVLRKLPDDVKKILISKEPIKIKGDIKNLTTTDFLLHDNY